MDAKKRIAWIKARRGIGRLIKILGQHPDRETWEMRFWAAIALGEIGNARAVDPLLASLEDTEVRFAAATALGEIGDARAIDRLVALLGDADYAVQQAAAEALPKFENAPVEQLVIRLQDEEASFYAGKALAKIGPPAIDRLLVELRDESSTVRSKVAYIVGEIGGPEVAEALVMVLSDSSPILRETAAYALAMTKDPRAFEPLIALLQDSNTDVRRAAAGALGDLEDHRAVDPLITHFRSDTELVAYNSAMALGRIGGPGVDVLTRALAENDRTLRSLSSKALKSSYEAGKLDSRFICFAEKIVYDAKACLLWPSQPINMEIPRIEADSAVFGFSGGGYTSWRLPTKEELADLFGACESSNDDFYETAKAACFEQIGFSNLIAWDAFYHSSSRNEQSGWSYSVGVSGFAVEQPDGFLGRLLPVTEVDSN